MNRIFAPFAAVVVAIGLSQCAPQNNMQRDAGTGAVLGAGAGAIIGHQSDHTAEGAVLGGLIGAGAGAAVGANKDKQQGR
ncbi:MAG: glycine zipper 2TM domain-containing protein [Akkermansiaceae bacterium]|nr:glycine zipper 2TM domain-containing protein [Akkermansiaceae bacterium]NNM28134.1 glycine zipper 2TM domain-containing protein [Akkermansiaceae bacterium]